jgi:L-ornithine N5-monooxygenase
LESSGQGTVYDVFGIGFGPSNLALAVALYEYNQAVSCDQRLNYRFVEKQREFSWHQNMLLPGTTMQISFLKDLATPRNPVSRFGFIAYLHERGRLAAFTNHKRLFPSRHEFHDYLKWAAQAFESAVDYGYEVTGVHLVETGGCAPPAAAGFEVVAADPKGRAPVLWRARNVVVATGLAPWLPDGVTSSDRVWHSEQCLERLSALPAGAAPEFVVVGAGQSAAEVTEHLLGCFPRGRVHAVMSRYGYSPADDSPFANEIFDAAAVDTFFHSSPETKRSLLDYHSNTNYSVVDPELIEALYRRYYQDLVNGKSRIKLHRMARISDLTSTADGVAVAIESLSSGVVEAIDADAVIYASGYRPTDPMKLLGDVAEICALDTSGHLLVGLDYRVQTTTALACGIFLQGLTEHIHGLSSSLLSNVAVRAGHIVESIAKAH